MFFARRVNYCLRLSMLDQVPKYLQDQEGSYVPQDLPEVIDSHVHIFPDRIFAAVWAWFDQYGWRIRYRMSASQVLNFLLSRGISKVVALQYAHKPGVAADLNKYMMARCQEHAPHVLGLATVFPGEQGAQQILEEAFAQGLAGVKLHAHVQCLDMEACSMQPVYDCCARNNKPLVIHAGREPTSAAYRCDPHLICSVHKVRRVLDNFPDLQLCVPHLGFDELRAYRELMHKRDNLWLDTTMLLAGYFPLAESINLEQYRWDRIMYGSDFPNIPYAWDRELQYLRRCEMSELRMQRLLCSNAAEFFQIQQNQEPVF